MGARDTEFRDAVRERYNGIATVWDNGDRWHEVVRREIDAAVARLGRLHPSPFDLVVDVGSGGGMRAVPHNNYLQLDIAEARLRGRGMSACADAHAMPLRQASADCLLCVGSVANYCSLIELVQELGRICKPGGYLLFHVELSNSLEYLLRPGYRANAALVQTHYQGRSETTWVYSLDNVSRSISAAGFRLLHARHFHIFPALAYRLGLAASAAARLAWADAVLSRVPFAGGVADSTILTCVKEP